VLQLAKEMQESQDLQNLNNNQMLNEEVSLIFFQKFNHFFYFIVNEIGSIWKGTTRMKKNNKGYERKAIKKLNKINRELKGLSNQVNEELYSSKREHQELVE
jgi:hypothetical protein